MTTTVRIAATKTAATYTATVSGESNFKANGLAINDKVLIQSQTGILAGTHDGSSNVAVLTDSGEDWGIDQFVGYTLTNTTDSSSTIVTSNTATTITGVLSGGTDDDWDSGDAYTLTGLTDLTFVDSGGKEGLATMEHSHNSRRISGPVDIRISKGVTVNAVEVVEYS